MATLQFAHFSAGCIFGERSGEADFTRRKSVVAHRGRWHRFELCLVYNQILEVCASLLHVSQQLNDGLRFTLKHFLSRIS